MSTIGVDIGGTKIAVGLVDDNAQLRATVTAPTPTTGAQAVLTQVAALIAALLNTNQPSLAVPTPDGAAPDCAAPDCGAPDPAAPALAASALDTSALDNPALSNPALTAPNLSRAPTAIGVGAPGLVDRDGVVHSATAILPNWQGARVRAELTRLTGLPVTVDNDVRALAFAEARHGAGVSHRRVLHVSVGTGIGGALTVDGELVRGSHDSVGEIAHLLVPARGPIPCGCGHFDHLEAIAAGPAIAAAAGEATVPAVVARMRDGDTEARAAITRAATILGRALAGFVTATDLDAVVVAGGVSRIGAEFLGPLAAALRAEIRPPGRAIPILPAALGLAAPVIGAGLLAREKS